MRLNFSTLALAVLVLAFAVIRNSWTQSWTAWQIAGSAIAVPAFAFFALARIQLGGAFSLQAKASTLVTGGIYARIRNPIYLFGTLMIVGIFVFVHRPLWLLILVVLIPVQWLRVRKEEQVLEATFGDAYREYKRKTWF